MADTDEPDEQLEAARNEFKEAIYRIFDRPYDENVWLLTAIENLMDARIAAALMRNEA